MEPETPTRQGSFSELVAVAAAALVALILFAGCTESGDQQSSTRGGILGTPLRERRLARVPSFSLIERSGKPIALANLKGKVWVVDFIFTRCPDACPLMSAQMAQLQSEFADAPDLRLVSISVDPEFDTPATLARYATQFHADPDRWYFLTGEKKTIYQLVREGFKLGLHDPDDPQAVRDPVPGDPARRIVLETLRHWMEAQSAWAHGTNERRQSVIHSNRFVLVDGEGWIRGYYLSTDAEALAQLRQDVRALLLAREKA